MATTHTEVYRPFTGVLAGPALRFLPLAAAEIRVALRRKLALLLLYLPPGIATVVFSFVVHAKYVAISQTAGGDLRARAIATLASQLVETRNEIVFFNTIVRVFALLAVAWYGAGLLAEDRRLGAHQLYFSRPLTRLDYLLAKFLVAAFFGALATLAPGLVICTVASFSSPDWAFLRDDADVIGYTVLYSALWIAVVALVVLAFSSVADRRSYALAGVFGFFMLTQGMGEALADIYREKALRVLGPFEGFRIIGRWMFETRDVETHRVGAAFTVIALISAVSLALIVARARRLEVVG